MGMGSVRWLPPDARSSRATLLCMYDSATTVPKRCPPPRAFHRITDAMDNIELMADGRMRRLEGRAPERGYGITNPHLWGLSPSCGGVAGQTDTMYRSASP